MRLIIVPLPLSLFLLSCSSSPNGQPLVELPAMPTFADSVIAGNPEGNCPVPEAALPEVADTLGRVVGDGSPESCTGSAVVKAVAHGGYIRFNCGPDPIRIELPETARIYNDSSDYVVIDGGGLVTLSGGGKHRILYMNTCDPELHWTTPHCDNQEFPQLTVQNLTLVDGNSRNEDEGGGAIFSRGGRFKVVNSRFFRNQAALEGPDVGGGAIRVFDQYQDRPVFVVNSTFGGADELGNSASNGGALSSIGVSWSIYNSVFSHNEALGKGGNPSQPSTPGGGSGGAIYNDGLSMTLSLCGSTLEHNHANAYGSAIFFVSNNHDGLLALDRTSVRNNSGGGWHTLPSIAMHEDTRTHVVESSLVE